MASNVLKLKKTPVERRYNYTVLLTHVREQQFLKWLMENVSDEVRADYPPEFDRMHDHILGALDFALENRKKAPPPLFPRAGSSVNEMVEMVWLDPSQAPVLTMAERMVAHQSAVPRWVCRQCGTMYTASTRANFHARRKHGAV